MVVLLPVFADMSNQGGSLNLQIIFESIFLVFLKISAFVIVMMVVGRKLLPMLLVAIASGFAFIAYTLFGASFALGAFVAGLILNESEIVVKNQQKDHFLYEIYSQFYSLFRPECYLIRWLF